MEPSQRQQSTPASSVQGQSAALVRRDEGSSNPASSSRSTLQQRILSEEEYTGTLSRLIQRDFFPHLARLEAENAYLDALQHLDEPDGQARLEAAVRRLVGHEEKAGIIPPTPRNNSAYVAANGTDRPSSTPSIDRLHWTPRTEAGVGDTPQKQDQWDPTPIRSNSEDEVTSSIGDACVDSQSPSLDGLNLSSFQTMYTSEDNASFLELLQKGQRRQREAHRWAYEAEKEANERRRRVMDASQREAQAGFEASLQNAPAHVQRRIEQGWKPKMITSNGEVGATDAGQQDGLRSQSATGRGEAGPAAETHRSMPMWQHRARNALFYGPDAERFTTGRRTSSLPSRGAARSQIDEYLANERTDRTPSVNFANTRLRNESEQSDSNSENATPRSSRIDAAIGGWLESSTAGSAAASDSGNGRNGSVDPFALASPRVQGYSFVSPLPSPRPGDQGEARVQQLLTWASVVATPHSSHNEEAEHDGSFKMPPTPKRDMLARQLADKASSSRKRHSASHHNGNRSLRHSLLTPKGSLPDPLSSRKRTRADLSPAARTLLDRTSRGTSLSGAISRRERQDAPLLATQTPEGRAAARKSHERLSNQRWTPSPSPRTRRE